jgi:hypothetical protein
MNGTCSARWHALQVSVSTTKAASKRSDIPRRDRLANRRERAVEHARGCSVTGTPLHPARDGGRDLADLVFGIAPVSITASPVKLSITVTRLDHGHVKASKVGGCTRKAVVRGPLDKPLRALGYPRRRRPRRSSVRRARVRAPEEEQNEAPRPHGRSRAASARATR